MRKTVDISELYDFIKARKDCWFVCCDIVRLMDINAISRQAGDIAILEGLKRMELCGGDEDVVFRIGADEFVMLTNSTDKAYADSVVEKIRSMNGIKIPFEGAEVPLSLYATSMQVEQKVVRYNELFQQLQIRNSDKQNLI